MNYLKLLFITAIAAISTNAAAIDAKVEKQIRDAMSAMAPGVAIGSIEESPIPGIYEMLIGAEVIYASADGRYLIRGQIFDMVTKEDIAEAKMSEGRLATLEQFNDANTLLYSPAKGKTKHTVTVFSDIDCGYCRKLHRELEDYHAQGIAIRYLLYPRAGEGSESYKKAVSVWCSKDRNDELTKAKMGAELGEKKCEHPILEHMQAGRDLGLRGTPMMILESGEVISGYVPAADLAKRIGAK